MSSVRWAAKFVEGLVEVYGKISEDRVKRELEVHGVEADRVDDAIGLGLVRGRFVRRTGDDGVQVLQRPAIDAPRFDPRVGRGRR